MDQLQAAQVETTKDNWDLFIERLQPVLETPIKIKEIRKVIKLNEKAFPQNQCVLNHFRNKFSIETCQESRSKWHSKDKLLLIWCVVKLHDLEQRPTFNPTQEDWEYLSKALGVKPMLLNLKWLSLLKTNLKDSPWSPEEDQLLIRIANEKQFQKNWTDVAIDFNQQMREVGQGNKTRYAKQIRERWNNYLDPRLKRLVQWDAEERKLLFKLVNEMGKKWSKISQAMIGRTENQVKNHYHSVLKYFQKNISSELTEADIIQLVITEVEPNLELIVLKRKTEICEQKTNERISNENQMNTPPDLQKKVKVTENAGDFQLNKEDVPVLPQNVKMEEDCHVQLPNLQNTAQQNPQNVLTPSLQQQYYPVQNVSPLMSPLSPMMFLMYQQQYNAVNQMQPFIPYVYRNMNNPADNTPPNVMRQMFPVPNQIGYDPQLTPQIQQAALYRQMQLQNQQIFWQNLLKAQIQGQMQQQHGISPNLADEPVAQNEEIQQEVCSLEKKETSQRKNKLLQIQSCLKESASQ